MKVFNVIATAITMLLCPFFQNGLAAQQSFPDYLQTQKNQQKVPAVSVLIFKADQVLYEQNLGNSNLENNTPLANDHLYLLASVSKTITGTALMQLVEAEAQQTGKTLSEVLNTSINNYLTDDDPNFSVNVPDFSSTPITVKMLLTHTSSIKDDIEVLTKYTSKNTDPAIELKEFLRRYLVDTSHADYHTDNFSGKQPGTEFIYSNVGTALMGFLVEVMANQNFSDYCEEHIFTPLGMDDSYWYYSDIQQDNKTIVTPYGYDCDSEEHTPLQHSTFADYPNGGLRSTARDLHRFLRAFTNDGNSNNHQLLQPATVAEMIKAQIPGIKDDQGDIVGHEIGLHFVIEGSTTNDGDPIWGHEGGEDGTATMIGFNPADRIGAIILYNQIIDPTNDCEDIELVEVLERAHAYGVELAAALPLQITEFIVEKQEQRVVLNWKTTAEVNTAGFEVQSSTDGKSFEQLAYVAAKNSSNNTYQFAYQPKEKTTIYYRIKQLNGDGSYEYSPIRNVAFAAESNILLAPNPLREQVTITYQLATSSQVTVSIYDVNGREVANLFNQKNQEKGIHQTVYNAEQDPNGIYTIVFKINDQVISKRLLLMK